MVEPYLPQVQLPLHVLAVRPLAAGYRKGSAVHPVKKSDAATDPVGAPEAESEGQPMAVKGPEVAQGKSLGGQVGAVWRHCEAERVPVPLTVRVPVPVPNCSPVGDAKGAKVGPHEGRAP